MTVRRWRVIESERFKADMAAIGPEGHDWSDAILGVRWYLERGPMAVGHGTQDIAVRIFMQDTPNGLPDLKIFYLVEPGEVILLRAREAEPLPF